MCSLITRTALALITATLAMSEAQTGNPKELANVTVIAVDGIGTPLKNAIVDAFVDEQGRDLVRLFRKDRGVDVPYGKYRISVQANGPYREATLDVEVNLPEVIITASLEDRGLVDNARLTWHFRGRLVGFHVDSRSVWCKASGLYSRLQYESTLGSGLQFDFGDVPRGVYILSCTESGTVFHSRPVTVKPEMDFLIIRASDNERLKPERVP
jgi:hypothetical protein